MPRYHAMISDDRMVKYNTVDANGPMHAFERARNEWRYNGGAAIAKAAVYEVHEGDPSMITAGSLLAPTGTAPICWRSQTDG